MTEVCVSQEDIFHDVQQTDFRSTMRRKSSDISDISTSNESSTSIESMSSRGSSVSNNNNNEVHYVKGAKVLGVHKRERPKASYLFVIIVKWSDKSQVTIYRKWSEIKELQADSLKVASRSENIESRKYLKKMKNRVNAVARFLRGTMQKLKMLDSLNQYFEAVLHFKDVAHCSSSRKFFKPNDMDLRSTEWSGDGRTYFYVTRDLLGERNQSYDDDSSQNMISDEEQDIGIELLSEEHESSVDDAINKFHEPDPNISWPIKSEVHVAMCDYKASDDDKKQNIISIQVGEEVDVLNRDECGWWLVNRLNDKRQQEGKGSTICGYVPASFLRRKADIGPTSINQILQNTDEIDYESNTVPDGRVPMDVSQQQESEGTVGEICSDNEEDDVIGSLNNFMTPSSLTSSSSESLASLDQPPMQNRASFRGRAASMLTLASRAPSSGTANVKSRNARRLTLDNIPTHFLSKGVSLPNFAAFSQLHSASMSNLNQHSSSIKFVPVKRGVDYISIKKYEATSSDEISFNESAIITVLQKNPNGWWTASYKDQIGVVPGVHLKRYNDPLRQFSVCVFDMI